MPLVLLGHNSECSECNIGLYFCESRIMTTGVTMAVDRAMRAAEWINLGFFAFLVALAWQRRLAFARRAKVTVLGMASIGIVLGVQFLDRLFKPLPVSVIRDWLPALLFLVAYWTAGLFFSAPSEKLQSRLVLFDRRILGRLKGYLARTRVPRWIAAYLELAYLFCYPLLPFGIGVLYIARLGRYADEFWTIVLSSAYLCFAALPFAQTLPPRMLTTEVDSILPPAKIRAMNLWILHYGSIQVNTFPSAHVATAFSISLALLHLLPLAGLAFLWISVSIAIGAVLGRYHYAADAFIGAAVALAVFLLAGICF